MSILLLTGIFTSCSENNKQSNDYPATTKYSVEHLDSLINYIQFNNFNGANAEKDSLIRIFNDKYIVKNHPFYTLKAYITAYSGSYEYKSLTLKDKQLQYQILYGKFKELAVQYNSKHLFAYLDYLEARNYQELNLSEKALPAYLNLLPRFSELNDSSAIGLINKRIGLIFMWYTMIIRKPYNTLKMYIKPPMTWRRN